MNDPPPAVGGIQCINATLEDGIDGQPNVVVGCGAAKQVLSSLFVRRPDQGQFII